MPGGIRDANVSPKGIGFDKINFPYILSGKHTDGSLPKVIWVAKGGADGLSSAQGGRDEPYLTVNGTRGAMVQTVDGRGDRIILGPGIWRENWDLGSGTGTTGAAGRMNKRDIGIYGSGGAHPGRTQIVSDGTTTGPTVRVRSDYLRGFILTNVEIGNVDSADADRAQYGVDLETDDTGTLTANSNDEWAVLSDVRFDGGATGRVGLYLTGTTMLRCYNLEATGWIFGVVFRGSRSNFPDHCHFRDCQFQDNVTADIGTSLTDPQGVWSGAEVVGGAVNMTNITFLRNLYKDRGGTPVTNFVNIAGTTVNCGDYEFVAARDVADATLMQLPIDWIAIGRSAAAAEFIIGA